MDRHVRTTFAVIATLALMMVGVAGSVVPSRSSLDDFFRAARLRDNADPRQLRDRDIRARGRRSSPEPQGHHGQPERSASVSLKQYAKAFDDAKAADESFTSSKSDYQRVNIDAIKRVVDAEVARKPVGKKDVPIKDAWDEVRDDPPSTSKAVSDARAELNASKASPN